MRIAWIGSPSDGGGVGGFCRQLLSGLIDAGEDVTVFGQSSPEEFREVMGQRAAAVRLFSRRPNWEWNRWYSRNGMAVFLSSFWARSRAHNLLVRDLVQEHQREPFDVVLQFSQTELLGLGRHLGALPPVLLFPCVHAAGELRWHRKEYQLARRSESLFKNRIVRANLIYRSRLQRQSCRAVHGVIGMSRRFNELVARDYGLDPRNQAVVYQPIDPVDSLRNGARDGSGGGDHVVRLLYVGRIAVRKGVEMLVDLSQRLDDMADRVEINVVGAPSFWSDYSGVLSDLNPRVGRTLGSLPNEEVQQLMMRHDALLTPSHYEPGGIVVAEAMSHGCVVIASDEVGSAEPFTPPVCRHFTAGDCDAFEAEVRRFVEEAAHSSATLRCLAAEEAARRLDPAATAGHLRRILQLAANRAPISRAGVPERWCAGEAVTA